MSNPEAATRHGLVDLGLLMQGLGLLSISATLLASGRGESFSFLEFLRACALLLVGAMFTSKKPLFEHVTWFTVYLAIASVELLARIFELNLDSAAPVIREIVMGALWPVAMFTIFLRFRDQLASRPTSYEHEYASAGAIMTLSSALVLSLNSDLLSRGLTPQSS